MELSLEGALVELFLLVGEAVFKQAVLFSQGLVFVYKGFHGVLPCVHFKFAVIGDRAEAGHLFGHGRLDQVELIRDPKTAKS